MEPAKLTILGSSPAWTNPDGAGSGYLLRQGSTAVQIEAGSGTFGRLRAVLSVDQLSGVVISHVHGDHFLDLVPLCYGLRYGRLRGGIPLPVFVPPGCIEYLSNFAQALNGEPEFFSEKIERLSLALNQRRCFPQMPVDTAQCLHVALPRHIDTLGR